MAGLVGWWRGGRFAARGRLGARAGLARLAAVPASTRRARLLALAIIVAVPAVVLPGLAAHRPPPTFPGQFLLISLSAGIFAASQLAGLGLRVGSTTIFLGFGETAVIVLLHLLPAGWVPLAVLLGGLVTQLVLRVAGRPRPAWVAAFNASVLTFAAACAALLAVLLARAYHTALTPRVSAALVLAALCYSAIAVLVVTAVGTVRGGAPFRQLLPRVVTHKAFMAVGNITLGLLAVAMLRADPRWLVAFPPVLWLLRQSYAYHLRAGDERRSWQVFSRATRALNGLDERSVATAAVLGAVRLFVAESAEVLVCRPDGTGTRYAGGPAAPVTVDESVATVAPGDGTADRRSVARPLLVGDVPIGELRVRFGNPVSLTSRELMQLSAFGEAIAAALHDTAAHDRLLVLAAQSSMDALRDPLTGVANRAALLAEGDAALRTTDRDAPIALLLLDINHFKEVNDTLGHAAGDELLAIAAQRLRDASGPGELVARLGGDEFGLLVTSLPAVDGAPDGADGAVAGADRRAREIADRLAEPVEVAGVQLAVEVSVGVVVATAASCDMAELLRRADIAMYRAKRRGTTVARYDSAGDVGSIDRLTLLAELREALTSRQLVLAFQPAIHLGTGLPVEVEALVRWRHPRRGELASEHFADVLENSALVTAFTWYTLDLALATAAGWVAEGLPVPVAVHVPPQSLLDRDLPDRIGELLARYGLAARLLVLEIVESTVVPEHPVVIEVLGALRALGIQLAVDDFGTGYSPLTFLTRIQVDEVRVDASLVDQMLDGPRALAIVHATVDLARQLDVRVVAEGVETPGQRAALAELGCTAAQGTHFSAPVPAEKATGMLHGLFRKAGGRVIPLRAEDAS
jgi:diguanylate cyclase